MHNTLIVQLRNHDYVAVFHNGKKIVGSRGPAPVLSISMPPGTYYVQTDGEIEELTSKKVERLPSPLAETQEQCFLHLTSDAPDQHTVDGVGEIPADGTSFCTITVDKLSIEGTPLTGDDHQDELFIRTTGGIVMDEAGENRIRSLRLQSGQAKFRLVSEPNPKVVTVSVFGRNLQQSKTDIQIEFI